MRTKPECNVAERRPKPFAYHSVSFRFVRYRSVHSAENRAQSNGALILWRKAASLECPSPRSDVGMLWQPPGDEQKPRKAFSKSGRSPRSLNLQRVRVPLCKAHKRNETERYRGLNQTVLPLKTGNKRHGK